MKKSIMVLVIISLIWGLTACSSKIHEGNFVFRHSGYYGETYLIKYTGNDASVEVPAKIKGKDVDGADEGAFQNLPNLENVYFLGNRTTLRGKAFENCPKLTKVAFAGETGYISDYAFVGCPSMSAKTASSTGGSSTTTSSTSTSDSTSSSGVVGTWKKQYAQYENQRVDESRLGQGVYIPKEFIVYSNGTATANNFSFSWSGSGSNVKFSYNGRGETQAVYDAANNQLRLGFVGIYKGQPALIRVLYKK